MLVPHALRAGEGSVAGQHCFPAHCCDLGFCKVVFPIIAGNDDVFFLMTGFWQKSWPTLLIGVLRLCRVEEDGSGCVWGQLGAVQGSCRKFIRDLIAQRY